MLRLRFAPSPTGFLHIGSARTFIFNWLYARRRHGTMILRIDDTDVERNTEASVQSIYAGLRVGRSQLGRAIGKHSERLTLHRQVAEAIFQKGEAYRDFTPAHTGDTDKSAAQAQLGSSTPGMREMHAEESDCRAAAGEPVRVGVSASSARPRESVHFKDHVYGDQTKATADIEDFALLRSDGMPTYHLGSCADDADLRISHIVRGQDHLSNTFKHVLIFEAAGSSVPEFAHLPLLVAPDGAKLSKRKHGPVVSVTNLRRCLAFLPQAFSQLICSARLVAEGQPYGVVARGMDCRLPSLEGINRSNARSSTSKRTILSTQKPPLAQSPSGIRHHAQADLAKLLLPVVEEAGHNVTPAKMAKIAPLVHERIKLLRDVLTVGDFFFTDQLAPYDSAELIPQKGDPALAPAGARHGHKILETAGFFIDPLEAALRAGAEALGIKTGQDVRTHPRRRVRPQDQAPRCLVRSPSAARPRSSGHRPGHPKTSKPWQTPELRHPPAHAGPSNFIRDIMREDTRTNKWGGRVLTRFPPEPNGYLHIGHAKSLYLNFGLAAEFGGKTNLRFDDTNPEKEEVEYVESIKDTVKWLGYDWEDRIFYASDYFGQLYEWAVQLINEGKAYVDDLSAEEIR